MKIGQTQKQDTDSNDSITPYTFTRKSLDRFKQIILQDYGLKLSDEEAADQASRTLNFFDVLIENRHLLPKKKSKT